MMKKAVVWDPVMRSSARKYDPCIQIEKGRCKIKCEDCKITLIADRFLGEEFQREILGKLGKSKGRYPYVIIVDTLGCNLRCWFCYAYKFFDKRSAEENDCEISYVSPTRLAEQFACKIRKLSKFEELLKIAEEKEKKDGGCKGAVKHLKMKLPLMRVRISGGEPIFSNKETLLDPIDQNNLIISTIKFWLQFFEELDKHIGEIKKEGKLNIIEKNKIKNKEWKGDLPFPTCIAERPGRLNVRFDTNGILFGNWKVAEAFIGGLFDLFKQNKLNNLFIQIDYSFKGATPVEYWWSQRKKLPVDSSKINFDYKLDEHPQWNGYKNIIEVINKYCKQDKSFSDCVGITVEKGIDHHIPYKTYLYCREALNWSKFSEKTGIKFSVVNNPIEMFNWRNWRPKTCFIENGANIKIIDKNGDEFDLSKNPDIDEFDSFRRKHYPDCYFLIYPIDEKITLKKKQKGIRKRLPPSQTKLVEIIPTGWVFSGSPVNWKVALKEMKWGLKKKHEKIWKRIRSGDYVLFYVTRPYSRIIGFARVKKIVEEDLPLWPDEIKEHEVKYPLRIIFEKVKIIEDWNKGLKPSKLNVRHGINPIYERQELETIIQNLSKL
ncbi:EVE domain-containing protein [Archaeoglobus neptunius]|uniref:EVE domain-containing protein n=1 Tax=Archaeoglobus neptunius TaxID=2798580 RepID=UPI001926B0D5|nr:EVE domain-containing protein [Archaeoglobus neptunius]